MPLKQSQIAVFHQITSITGQPSLKGTKEAWQRGFDVSNETW